LIKKNDKLYVIGKDGIDEDEIYLILDFQLNSQKKLKCDELSADDYDIFFSDLESFRILRQNRIANNMNLNCEKKDR